VPTRQERNHDTDTTDIGIGYGAQPLVCTVPTQKVSSIPVLIVTVIDVRHSDRALKGISNMIQFLSVGTKYKLEAPGKRCHGSGIA
jgi:hypothetical protein